MKIVWSLAAAAFVLISCERTPSPFDTCLMQNTVNHDDPTPARLVIHDFYESGTVRVLVNGETIVDGPLDSAQPETGLNQVGDVELFEFNYVELERGGRSSAVCLHVPLDVRHIYLTPDFEIASSNTEFILLD